MKNDLTDVYDIEKIKGYENLKIIPGLFEQVQLDESRTCIFWNDFIDLPSDAIYEYGKAKAEPYGYFTVGREASNPP